MRLKQFWTISQSTNYLKWLAETCVLFSEIVLCGSGGARFIWSTLKQADALKLKIPQLQQIQKYNYYYTVFYWFCKKALFWVIYVCVTNWYIEHYLLKWKLTQMKMDWLLECNAGNNLRSTWSVGYLLSAEQGNGGLSKKHLNSFLVVDEKWCMKQCVKLWLGNLITVLCTKPSCSIKIFSFMCKVTFHGFIQIVFVLLLHCVWIFF